VPDVDALLRLVLALCERLGAAVARLEWAMVDSERSLARALATLTPDGKIKPKSRAASSTGKEAK